VGNLSYNTTEQTLQSLFAQFGQVESVNIISDRDTGRPKGFGSWKAGRSEGEQPLPA
jgi:RNA recognition motif-containing protein